MKALFAKEYRQSHLLLWMGLLLSALIAALYAAWSRKYVRTLVDQRDLDALCGYLLLVIAGVMTYAAASGLFPSETARGTLPYLLSLPISRTRIWLAKALAGLALTLSAALLLILPDALVIPGVVREIHLALYLPDLIIGLLFAFSVTLFCSTLFQRTISVLLASLVSTAALAIGLALLLDFGGPLLGYDGLLDLSIAALALVPALLFASWFTFVRGELLQSNRKWALALPSLLAGLALVSLLLVGASRRAYRYQRSEVSQIEAVSMPSGGSAAVLLAQGSRAPYSRTPLGWERGHFDTRSRHLVALDLRTGRELLVLRGNREAVVSAALSPDGHFLALAPGPVGAAGGGFEVWDLPAHRRLLRALPRRWRDRGLLATGPAAWSPNSQWLALSANDLRYQTLAGPPSSRRELLLVMRPDGEEATAITLWEVPAGNNPSPEQFDAAERTRITGWDWAPDGAALYTLDWKGHITRHLLPGGKAERVWQPPIPGVPLSPGRQWRFANLRISPDGKWLVLAASSYRTGSASAPAMTLLVASDGSQARPLAPTSLHVAAWSPDGRHLYLIRWGQFELMRWQEGDREAVPIPAPPLPQVPTWVALPNGDLLVWTDKEICLADKQGRFRPLPDARLRALPLNYEFDGLDREGRLLLKSRSAAELAIADLATAAITRIYP